MSNRKRHLVVLNYTSRQKRREADGDRCTKGKRIGRGILKTIPWQPPKFGFFDLYSGSQGNLKEKKSQSSSDDFHNHLQIFSEANNAKHHFLSSSRTQPGSTYNPGDRLGRSERLWEAHFPFRGRSSQQLSKSVEWREVTSLQLEILPNTNKTYLPRPTEAEAGYWRGESC